MSSIVRSPAIHSPRNTPPPRPQSRPNGNSSVKAEGGSGQQKVQASGSPRVYKDNASKDAVKKTTSFERSPANVKPCTEIAVQNDFTSSGTWQTQGDDEYPPFVVRAFGNRFPKLSSIYTDIIVPDYRPDEWRQLKEWYEQHDDINKFQFEYDQSDQELTTKPPTDIHDRVAATMKTFANMVFFQRLRLVPPEWMTQDCLFLNISAHEYVGIRTNRGVKNVPDLLAGFSIDQATVVWTLLEIAKSQGLYTKKTAKDVIGSEGVLNKLLDYMTGNLEMSQKNSTSRIIDLDCLNLEEVVSANGEGGWRYKLDGNHAFHVEDLKWQEDMFNDWGDRLRASAPLDAGLIARSGPFFATTRSNNETHTACFGGAYRLSWIHIPVDDQNARALLNEAVKGKKPMGWWLDTKYAIRILDPDEYSDDEKIKVKAFLDMVSRDFKKKIVSLADALDREATIRDVLRYFQRHDIPRAECLARAQELIDFTEKLRDAANTDLADHFQRIIPLFVKYVQDGALATAKGRLVDKSSVKLQAVYEGLPSAAKFNTGANTKRKLESLMDMVYGKKRMRDTSER